MRSRFIITSSHVTAHTRQSRLIYRMACASKYVSASNTFHIDIALVALINKASHKYFWLWFELVDTKFLKIGTFFKMLAKSHPVFI